MSATKTPAAISSPACLSAQQLAQASTPVEAPFDVMIGPDMTLRMINLLRVLPQRRYVGEARLGEQAVLAKLFVSSSGTRHFERELSGIRALAQAGIASPGLLGHGALPGGGHYLLTEFLNTAETFSRHWQALSTQTNHNPDPIAQLGPLFGLVGQLHAAGLIHEDLHLGNLLLDGQRLLLIDGDAVRGSVGQALAADDAMANLAMLVAQLPVRVEALLPPLLEFYQAAHPAACRWTLAHIATAINKARQARWADYRSKLARSCSGFVASQSWQRRCVVQRSHQDLLQGVMTKPDHWVAQGQPLKLGNSATVARIRCDHQSFVIKRYNIKHFGHALSRALRPTRAWHSWIEGHRLESLGIATPTPRAVFERRFGPLRGKSWLIVDDVPGEALHEVTDVSGQTLPQPTLAQAIIDVFQSLCRVQISHGDLKASNLIWYQERLYLIDLDATAQHRDQSGFLRAWQKDRARLLRNWPENSPLHQWLDEVLP